MDSAGAAGVSPPPDVVVEGGDFSRAVLGNKIVNKTVIKNYNQDASLEPSQMKGSFRLTSSITVWEKKPISLSSHVYQATLHSEVIGDREIAVKILSNGERECREALIHFNLPHHRNIVQCLFADAFNYRGLSSIYLAMERCDPLNLYDYIKLEVSDKVSFDSDKYISYSFQIALGLDFLHRHDVINRDLKPHNVLLSEDGKVVKICDFGLSKVMTSGGDATNQSMVQPGTDGWRSPELLKGATEITKSSDVYSLALVIGFAWSHGKHLFGDDPHSWNHYMKRNENLNFGRLKIQNYNLGESLLKSMLLQNPSERPTTAQIIQHEVFRSHGTGEATTESKEAGLEESLKKIEDFRALILADGRESLEIARNEIHEKCFLQSFRQEIWTGTYGDRSVAEKFYVDISPETFLEKVKVLQLLSHENIVDFYGVVICEKSSFISEYSTKGSLLNVLRREGCDIGLKDKMDMAAQIASGMAYVASMKYVHTDLRADNIVVAENMICKISGFDSAKYFGTADEWQVRLPIRLAIRWLSPGVFDKGIFSQKSDVWSFGIVLTEMVTNGGLPYPGLFNNEVLKMIEMGFRMPQPQGCPKPLYEIMLKCWDKIPERRPDFEWLEVELQKDYSWLTTEDK